MCLRCTKRISDLELEVAEAQNEICKMTIYIVMQALEKAAWE